MTTFSNAMAQLHGRTQKKIANNTYARLEDGAVLFRLHQTDIVTVTSDDTVYLNSGGWQTHTTKERLNSILSSLRLPFAVHQNCSVWYLSNHKNEYAYADNMTIKPDNTITGAGEDPQAQQKLIRKVQAFSREFARTMLSGQVNKPSAGDCFYCAMVTTEKQPLGEAIKDKDHILSHLDEKYFVPSLLVNAVKFYPVSKIVESCLWAVWSGTDEDKAQHAIWQGIAEKQITRSISQYIRSQLGIVR